MIKQNKAFTLVELIVVITILAILGTIAFLSYQGYSKTARDSKRISDINNLKTSLALFQTKTGTYPVPDNGENVTYSGSVVWSQGVIGDNVFKNLTNINKKPIDPLTDSEYTYSLLNTKKEYEIGSVLEGSETANVSISNETYALGEQTTDAYITGDYNGIVAKVSTGSLTYVLSVPSIISSEVGDLLDIINHGTLSYNGYKNLPKSYSGTTFNINGETDLTLTNKLVVFSGTLNDLRDSVKQIQFIIDLQAAYSGTELSNIKEINNILVTDTTGNIEGTKFLAQSLIQKTIDRTISVTASTTILGNQGSTVCNLSQTEVDTLNSLAASGWDLAAFYDSINWVQVGPTEEDWCNASYIRYGGALPIPPEIWKLKNMTEFELASGVTNIPPEIFNFPNLKSLLLSYNSITSIPPEIGNLVNLTKLSLNSNSITSLPPEIGNLVKLQTLELNNNPLGNLPSEIWNFTDLTRLSLSNTSLTSLPPEIWNFTNLTDLDLSYNSFTGVTIPGSAVNTKFNFSDNSLLSSVIIENGIINIPEYSFMRNPSLTSVIIPNSVTNILYGAFTNTAMTSITIPNSVTNIGGAAFSSNHLTSIIIPNSVTIIGEHAFRDGNISTLTIGNGVTFIGDAAFYNNKLTTVIIPSNVTNIRDWAFTYNKLTSVTIPSNVTNIGGDAFSYQNDSVGGGTVYGPSTGYVNNAYMVNGFLKFDKSKLPNYIGNQP